MATQKFLDQNGLQTFWGKIKTTIADQLGNAVLKTGDHTMAGKLTANGGFKGNLIGKADTAGTADKTKESLTITVKKKGGISLSTTFNGNAAQTATIDMSALTTDAELNAAIESLGNEIDDRVRNVTADDTLITATTSAVPPENKAVRIGPTQKLTTAVGFAEGAVRSVTKGDTNGYIKVNTGGTSKDIQVANFSSYITDSTLNNAVNGLSASIDANSQEITSIKGSIAGGTHFIGVSTTAITDKGTQKPTIGGTQKKVTAGDIVIYGNKEFIWNGSAWAELGDTTAESERISALETWKTTASATISSNSAGVTAAAEGVTANATAIANLSKAVVKSFGGKTGAITVDTAASTITAGTTTGNGKATVNFAMSDNKLTAEVALPSQIWINKSKIESLTTSHTSLSGTVNTIKNNYASKTAAVGSITSSKTSPDALTAISATGNITTWTITPKNVAGTALTTAKIIIESIPDSWINALS